MKLSWTERGDLCAKSGLGIRFEGGERIEKFVLGFICVDAEKKIDERGRLGFARAGDDRLGENVECGELLRRQEKRFAILGGEVSITGVE